MHCKNIPCMVHYIVTIFLGTHIRPKFQTWSNLLREIFHVHTQSSFKFNEGEHRLLKYATVHLFSYHTVDYFNVRLPKLTHVAITCFQIFLRIWSHICMYKICVNECGLILVLLQCSYHR